jgi:hypothetical protein
MLRPLDEGTLIQLHVVHNLKFASHPGPGKIVPCARRKTPHGKRRSIMTNALRRFALSWVQRTLPTGKSVSSSGPAARKIPRMGPTAS